MMTGRTAGKAMSDLLNIFNLVREVLKGFDYFTVEEAAVWLKTDSGQNGFRAALCQWAEGQFEVKDWASRIFAGWETVTVSREVFRVYKLKTLASGEEIIKAHGGSKYVVDEQTIDRFLKKATGNWYVFMTRDGGGVISATRSGDGWIKRSEDRAGRWSVEARAVLLCP